MDNLQARASALKNFWMPRDLRIRDMYELRRLVNTLKLQGYESAVTNDPKNELRLAVYLLSALPVKHVIPSGLDEAEQGRNAILERALASFWREKDLEQRATGRKPWRWEFADLLCMTGWYAVVVGVGGSASKPELLAEVLNPARVYPEWGDEGLTAVLYEYEMSDAALSERAARLGWDVDVAGLRSKPLARASRTIGLLWEQKDGGAVQSVLVDGYLAAEQRTTDFKRIPMLVGAVGGESLWGGFSETDSDWVKHYGESLLESNYDVYQAYNRWLTYHMQLTKDAAQSLILHQGGVPGSVRAEDIKAGKILDVLPGENVSRMENSRVPVEVNALLGNFQAMMQRGGFPWTLFGLTGPLELSGFAISQLLTAAYATIGEQHATMQSVIGQIDMLWLEELKKKKVKPFSFITRKPGVVGLVKEEFSPELIGEHVYVEAHFALAAPKDTMERLAAARQAQPDGRLLDSITVLEDILEVEDTQLVKERLNNDFSQELPEVRQIKVVGALRRYEKKLREQVEPDNELADLMANAWKTMLANLGAGSGGTQQPEAPGLGMMLPPESRGQPRTAERAMLGIPPAVPPQGMGNIPGVRR